MNLSVADVKGSMLIISQFTLYGDCRKGKRPSWSDAAKPAEANRLYEMFIAAVKEKAYRWRRVFSSGDAGKYSKPRAGYAFNRQQEEFLKRDEKTE